MTGTQLSVDELGPTIHDAPPNPNPKRLACIYVFVFFVSLFLYFIVLLSFLFATPFPLPNEGWIPITHYIPHLSPMARETDDHWSCI